jgi:hypothetical protein
LAGPLNDHGRFNRCGLQKDVINSVAAARNRTGSSSICPVAHPCTRPLYWLGPDPLAAAPRAVLTLSAFEEGPADDHDGCEWALNESIQRPSPSAFDRRAFPSRTDFINLLQTGGQ